MNTQNVFGSVSSTGVKLDIIREYIAMYQKTLGQMSWASTNYIDAFAGSGQIPLVKNKATASLWAEESSDDNFNLAEDFIKGSTQLALEISPPFSKYTFIEKDKNKFEELQILAKENGLRDRIDCRNGDANIEVQKICRRMTNKDRAVVFLDPFGSQVEWDTIKAIAATKAIDMWYLFPAGLGVFRQISRDGKIHKTHSASIDRLFGTPDWRTAFVKRKKTRDLFDQEIELTEKTVTPESAADFMIDRLKSVFKGSVGDFKVPLGKHAYPSYYLLFASGNPTGPAKSLAAKLSKAAVKAIESKNGKPFGN